MKKSLLCFISILFFIIACTPLKKGPVSGYKPEAGAQTAEIGQKQEISAEVMSLLDKSKTRVQSIYYKYRGPETTSVGYNIIEFYIKGNKIKYKPTRELKSLDRPESYDVIYIDTASHTAQTYCDDRTCIYKGKKGDLNYNGAYILTIFDWTDGIKQANKVGEEVIEDRNVWKVGTNEGSFWLDTFYGIPLRIESSGKIYQFQQIAVNSVQDADVNPSS